MLSPRPGFHGPCPKYLRPPLAWPFTHGAASYHVHTLRFGFCALPVPRDLEFLCLITPTFRVGHLILSFSLALFVSKLQYPVCHPLASRCPLDLANLVSVTYLVAMTTYLIKVTQGEKEFTLAHSL